MPAVFLADRSVISVAGEDARKFLQGLVTCDMGKVAPGAPGFGALLTPQGKILFDFLIVEEGGRFLLDTAREKAAEFLKRLGMYRLRSKVELADLSADSSGDAALAVCALFGADAPEPPPEAIGYRDPRAENLGRRAIMPAGLARAFAGDDPALYEAHRIACGAPKAGLDFPFGDAFPHEANMDLLHGVAFDKGCYVGQEVVSRMQHRGLVRKRFARVALDGPAEAGAEIRAGEIAIGSLGGVQDGAGLALVRLDRLAEAEGRPLLAGAAKVRVL